MENIASYLLTKIQTAFYKTEWSPYVDPLHKIWSDLIFSGEHGADYVFRSLIPLQKILGKHKVEVTIDQIADAIIQNANLVDFNMYVERNVLVINLKTDWIAKHISSMAQNDMSDLMKHMVPDSQLIAVDFSSPNIAKDLHVGHLRSTIIGESICRLFETLGHKVLRINHIGDFGLQFGMIIQHLYDIYPGFEEDTKSVSVQTITISDLQKFYAASKKRFDTDENFKKLAYQRVVELQSKSNLKVVEAWEFIKEVSRQSYNQIYERLGVHLDEFGESFYQSMIPEVIDELKSKNLLEFNDGRWIMFAGDIKSPLTVIKSDGGYTYDTTDMAAIKYRLTELKADRIIYVVDMGQSDHFKQIFGAAKKAGWLTTQQVEHVGFGIVKGEDGGKFRARDGNTIKLIDLLDEAVGRAKDYESVAQAEKAKKKQKKDSKVKGTEIDLQTKNTANSSKFETYEMYIEDKCDKINKKKSSYTQEEKE